MKVRKSDLELEGLVRRINDGELDLQPDFQRGEVWDSKRRQRLVDTILRSWYVPAVHIVVDADGEEVVLDGQQRLVAIRKFFADEVKVDGRIEPHDERISALHNLKFSQLPPAFQRAIKRFELQIITLTDYEPQEPNELFFRLNQAYNLTPPEKRNALHGEARDQVKLLVGDLTESGLLDSGKIGFTNGRLAYDDIIARTCVALEIGSLRQHINNGVVEDYYRGGPFSDSTVLAVRAAGDGLLYLINSAPERVRFNKGTLQTWLLFCFWFPSEGNILAGEILGDFEADRIAARNGTYSALTPEDRALVQILRQYDDRASYRVTDVSSVLIRDLSVQLYAQAKFSAIERAGSGELWRQVLADPEQAQGLMSAFLEASKWGEPLVREVVQ